MIKTIVKDVFFLGQKSTEATKEDLYFCLLYTSREYETLMAEYSEENQARLEKVMAEMDSLCLLYTSCLGRENCSFLQSFRFRSCSSSLL